MIEAPWTKEQVEALNAFQAAGTTHPFTCPSPHEHQDRALVATEAGWVCRHCAYTQNWAHAYMAQKRPVSDGEIYSAISEQESGVSTSEALKGSGVD